MLQQAHRRTSSRQKRVAFLLALSIGVLALAAPPPAPSSGVPARASALERAAVAEDASSDGATDTEGATSIPSSSPASPAPDTPAIRSDLGRADVAVIDPVPTVAARHVGGSKAVFLGDLDHRVEGVGIGRRGWPAIVGRTLGWRTVNLAVAGTGFMNPGWTNQTIGARVAATISQKRYIVVVAAGHNDSRWSVATTARAADAALDRLRRALRTPCSSSSRRSGRMHRHRRAASTSGITCDGRRARCMRSLSTLLRVDGSARSANDSSALTASTRRMRATATSPSGSSKRSPRTSRTGRLTWSRPVRVRAAGQLPGTSTLSMTWITPFDASTSARRIWAPST